MFCGRFWVTTSKLFLLRHSRALCLCHQAWWYWALRTAAIQVCMDHWLLMLWLNRALMPSSWRQHRPCSWGLHPSRPLYSQASYAPLVVACAPGWAALGQGPHYTVQVHLIGWSSLQWAITMFVGSLQRTQGSIQMKRHSLNPLILPGLSVVSSVLGSGEPPI